MPTLLVIDDRPQLRDMIVDLINDSLLEDSGWDIAGQAPLSSMDDYSSLIQTEDVAVLLLDERLSEQLNPLTGIAVDYSGHELIVHLRKQLPDFPIFAITAFPDEALLQEQALAFEDIIDRQSFTQDPDKYVSRMIRSGQRFAEALRQELAILGNFAEKKAKGSGTPEEYEVMQSIRTKYSLAFPASEQGYASEIIPHAEKLISDANSLIAEIRQGKKK